MNKQRTIMVVDDSDSDQLLMELMIEEFDTEIEIMKAYDGREALDQIEAAKPPPELIFLDINMPGMNAHEFLSEYHPAPEENTTIVMLTSSDLAEDRSRAMAHESVKQYLVKPITLDIVEALLEKYVSH